MTDLSTLEQKDQLASRSFQRRARSAAPAKTSRIPPQASPFRLYCNADTRRLEYANRPRFSIKVGLGAISSSRCQTAHAYQANLGRGSLSLLDEQNGPLQARRFLALKLARGIDKNYVGPEILRRNLSRNGCRTENCRNRRPSACQKTGLSGRTAWPIIGSRPPIWWSQTGSNRRPPACKAGALPTELWPLRGSVISRQ
jgi:hypothetical protein